MAQNPYVWFRQQGSGALSKNVDRSFLTWVIAIIAVIAANGAFLAINTAAAAAPAERLLERVRDAYVRADLTDEDYLWHDRRRGFNQFNDCVILLANTNRTGPAISRAIGPPVLQRRDPNPGWRDICLTLWEFASGDPVVEGYHAYPYTRYWHGYMPVASGMVNAFGLRTTRHLLMASVHLSLLLLVVAAGMRHRGLLMVASCISVVGLLFWALPHFGQGLSHAPGDIFVLLGLAALLYWRDPLSDRRAFIPFCALYGAGVVYLEFLTGQLPIASGLLFALAYVVSAARQGPTAGGREPWLFATAGLASFALGAVLTVAIKQVLVTLMFGAETGDFSGKLMRYTGVQDGLYSPMDRFVRPLIYTLEGGRILVYGSKAGTFLLYAATAIAWAAASILALRSAHRRAVADLLAFVFASAFVAAWIALLPVHTIGHNHWMSRMLLVPISLGWGGLLWQLWLAREAIQHTGRPAGVPTSGP
jgi:hypothetical protein